MDLLPEMLMGATMETMETFGEDARKAANGGTGVEALLGELPQQGEQQLSASARRRQKRLHNKRKRLLQEDVEAAEASAEAAEAEEALSKTPPSYLPMRQAAELGAIYVCGVGGCSGCARCRLRGRGASSGR